MSSLTDWLKSILPASWFAISDPNYTPTPVIPTTPAFTNQANVKINGTSFGTVQATDSNNLPVNMFLPSSSYDLENMNIDLGSCMTTDDMNKLTSQDFVTQLKNNQCQILSLQYDATNKFNAIFGTTDSVNVPSFCDKSMFPTPVPKYIINPTILSKSGLTPTTI